MSQFARGYGIIISPENQFILTMNDVKKGIKDTRQKKTRYIPKCVFIILLIDYKYNNLFKFIQILRYLDI